MSSTKPVLVSAKFNQGFQGEPELQKQCGTNKTPSVLRDEPSKQQEEFQHQTNNVNSNAKMNSNNEKSGDLNMNIDDEILKIDSKNENDLDKNKSGENQTYEYTLNNVKVIYADADIENGLVQINENGLVVSKSNNSVTPSNESDFEDDNTTPDHCCATNTEKLTTFLHTCLCVKYKYIIKGFFWIIVLLLYIAYFITAIIYSFKLATPLIVLTVLAVFCVALWVIGDRYGKVISDRCLQPCSKSWKKYWKYTKWVVYLGLLAAFIVFVVVDVRKDPHRLTSLSGIAVLLLITFIFSKHPSKIKWQPVIWGLVLQMLFGLLVLRWSVGLAAVKWFSEQVVTFLAYTDAGSRFVFGDDFIMHPFAFQSLPVVIFFSAVIGILYYWGIMQKLIQGMATLMQVTMGTTALETLATASNIFVSYVEVAPILVPYIHRLTKSELHAILTSGFATVAGSILAIYISFGAPAVHLISSCIISAPAALAIAKLSFPETKISKTKTQKDVHLPRGSRQDTQLKSVFDLSYISPKEVLHIKYEIEKYKQMEYCNNPNQKNFIEAAAAGAMIAIKLIAGIVACLIAFLAIVAFIDAVLAWLGSRIGVDDPPLSFSLICSYIFMPLTVMMGIPPEDAQRVASMLGLKIFVDDVLCYADLGEAVKNGDISDRSAVIATYACCGFGSLGALGVALGTMFSIAPKRKKAISDIIIRALINGNIAAFMTACVAGFLYPGPQFVANGALNTTDFYNSSVTSIPAV